jgi:phosphate starvation-inducible PhoH-like protein
LSSTQVRISVPANHLMPALLGHRDEVLRAIEAEFPEVTVHVRGNEIAVEGPDAERVGALFDMVRHDERPSDVLTSEVLRPARGRPVRPKSSGQKRYVDAVRDNVVTFALGPAGTGKSWLAVAMAVQSLLAKEVDRIILTRPAVEAGERLGFLPGDLMAKVDPYLRPLWDALHDMVGTEQGAKLLERGAVEVAPLAFMRGRTLNSSFIILDEAQNTTPEQMKMFLTRMGNSSKVVINGDVTQVDLPTGKQSGLREAQQVLHGVEGIHFVRFGERDVVRHPLVQRIVSAYERFDRQKAGGLGGPPSAAVPGTVAD